MKSQTTYKSWYYQFVYYVPVTPEGGGDITWNKCSEYREIYLPSEVENPGRYLAELGADKDVDIPEYNCFVDLEEDEDEEVEVD